MLDSGFIGHFPVGGTVLLFVQVRAQNLAMASAVGTPTYRIFRPDGYQTETGDFSHTISGLTGFWVKPLELTNPRDYQSGQTYTVVSRYNYGGSNRSSVSTFQVV